MNDNNENDMRPLSAKFRLRFSLLALMVFITLVCLLLAWLVQPNRVVATALFQVESTIPTALGTTAEQRRDEPDFETVKKTQLALLTSDFVLTAAVRNPVIASLSIFHGASDPVAWLRDHLVVSFPENAEILSIQLHGTETQAQDLVSLTNAVAKAYKDEVISEMRQRQLVTRDLLARNLENLNQELKRKSDEYLDIARESGSANGSGQVLQDLDAKRLDRIESEIMRLESDQVEAPSNDNPEKQKPLAERIAQLHKRQSELEAKLKASAEKSTDLEMRKKELEQLEHIASEISMNLERMDIEANSPERIRQIQQAVISPAK